MWGCPAYRPQSLRADRRAAHRTLGVTGSLPHVNQVKTRLQALGLLDRAFANVADEELGALLEGLGDDHREALDELVRGEATPELLRAAGAKGRLDGTLESVTLVLTDACLAECIEALGDHADHPSSAQLREVLPDIVEHHGLAVTQLMLASTVAGEAPAAAIIRDLLKNDETIKLPPVEHKPAGPIVRAPKVSPEERAAIKAKRKEMRQRKQREAQARREQAARARRRS